MARWGRRATRTGDQVHIWNVAAWSRCWVTLMLYANAMGKYRVDIYVNGTLDHTANYVVVTQKQVY